MNHVFITTEMFKAKRSVGLSVQIGGDVRFPSPHYGFERPGRYHDGRLTPQSHMKFDLG